MDDGACCVPEGAGQGGGESSPPICPLPEAAGLDDVQHQPPALRVWPDLRGTCTDLHVPSPILRMLAAGVDHLDEVGGSGTLCRGWEDWNDRGMSCWHLPSRSVGTGEGLRRRRRDELRSARKRDE